MTEVRVIPLTGIPEVGPGEELAPPLLEAAERCAGGLHVGDVLVVTQRVVSKAERRLVDLSTVEPSPFARQWAEEWGHDPRLVELVLREAKRIVKMDRGLIITETHHGFVCAASGVDASNVRGEGIVSLLPEDPDASAARLRQALQAAAGVELAVIITDTFGRPWRVGQTNVAIGVAGMLPLRSYIGTPDTEGRVMQVTEIAVADELAAAAELVMGKVERVPAAIIRGYRYRAGEGSGRDLLRPPEKDLFR